MNFTNPDPSELKAVRRKKSISTQFDEGLHHAAKYGAQHRLIVLSFALHSDPDCVTPRKTSFSGR